MRDRWVLQGQVVSFDEDTHEYKVNGKTAYSITQVLAKVFGDHYDNVPPEVLKKAAENGTAMHAAIENYEIYDREKAVENDEAHPHCQDELDSYRWLKREFKFECVKTEIPILLEYEGHYFCGRCDMVTHWLDDDTYGIHDHKRTAVFDYDKTAAQTNLYALGVFQTHGYMISKLTGGWYRNKERKLYFFEKNNDNAYKILDKFIEMIETGA